MVDLDMDQAPRFDLEHLQAAAAVPHRPNPLALLCTIWVRPRRVFQAVAEGPGWWTLLPLFLAVALTGARVVAAGQAQVQAQQAMTAGATEVYPAEMLGGEMDQFSESPPEAYGAGAMALALPLIGALAVILIGWSVRAGVLHLGGMALGGRQSFGSLYKVSLWASLPLILREAVQAGYMLLTGQPINGPGLSGLLAAGAASEGAAAMVAGPSVASILLERLDLYAVWYVVLLVIALTVTARLTRGKAIAVVSVYVLLSLLLGLTKLLTAGLTGGF